MIIRSDAAYDQRIEDFNTLTLEDIRMLAHYARDLEQKGFANFLSAYGSEIDQRFSERGIVDKEIVENGNVFNSCHGVPFSVILQEFSLKALCPGSTARKGYQEYMHWL